jgi:hypothetical protein
MGENLSDNLMQRIVEKNRRQDEEEFLEWYSSLAALPPEFELKLGDGWKADVELQPSRWMNRGLSLIQSAKITGYIQLPNGVQGQPAAKFLPYPVFHSGAEMFLKGMWLYHYEDCRLLSSASYVKPADRKKYLDEIKIALHDLIRIIKALQTIEEYQTDLVCAEFLKVLDALIRRDYFPLFEADAKGNEWAFARYPARFYDDATKRAGAHGLFQYSPQHFIERLFWTAYNRVPQLWALRAGPPVKEAN